MPVLNIRTLSLSCTMVVPLLFPSAPWLLALSLVTFMQSNYSLGESNGLGDFSNPQELRTFSNDYRVKVKDDR